jgi:release factor glutamine methyltransferase
MSGHVPVHDSVRAAAGELAAAGVPSPQFDAEELAAFSLGVQRKDLWRASGVGPEFAAYVRRRAAREPLQHITGRAHFRHLTLAVGPGVFVPRPETEVVVEAATAATAGIAAPVVVDLGTGSGAIALSVAHELPGARVHAVEADPGAYAWAARNAAGTGVDLRLGDMADAFPDLDGTVDVVVSNPPYIPVGALVRDPEVATHDPALALWSGPDGLDAVRVVERVAARLLRAGGTVVVEHADLQGESAPAVFAATGRWTGVADHRDLAGRDRYLTARRATG